MNFKTIISIVVLQLAASSIALAEPTPPSAAPLVSDTTSPSQAASTAHRHDGFFMRLQLGGGYRSTTVEEMSFTGAGPGVSLALGGALADNLILHGEVTSAITSDPTIEFDGESYETEDAKVTLNGIGPGLTYYVMPLNIYVGAAILLSTVELSADDETIGKTKTGIGSALRIGKEFWIGDDWALGVGGEFQFGIANDEVSDDEVSSNGFTLGLTATYN